MTFGSICSGIDAASVAWNPLGWKAAWFAEIEAFPSAVLKYRYPETTNLGDFTKIDATAGPIDVLVGGTPCQSFSVAGKRAGLDDPRGNLTLEFLALASRLRPRWLVWENVPGVMSDDGGRTFGTVLGLMGKLGYGFAYRILDAQHFGVPQRRRRVFVVGCLGDWRSAAAVLFERFSLSGNPPPSREARKDVAPTISARTKGGGGLGTDFDLDGGLIARCLNAGGTRRIDGESETFITTHALTAGGFDASEDGTGRGTPIIPILEAGARTGKSTDDARNGIGIGQDGDPMFTLQSGKQHAIAFDSKASGRNGFGVGDASHANGGGQVAVAFQCSQSGERESETHATLDANFGSRRRAGIVAQMAVRRLTPTECERLQGFPDFYTQVPYRGKPAADGPRYKALGNSMAVPVMAFIGRRIQMVEDCAC